MFSPASAVCLRFRLHLSFPGFSGHGFGKHQEALVERGSESLCSTTGRWRAPTECRETSSIHGGEIGFDIAKAFQRRYLVCRRVCSCLRYLYHNILRYEIFYRGVALSGHHRVRLFLINRRCICRARMGNLAFYPFPTIGYRCTSSKIISCVPQ